jgi:hypothetical protein
MSLTPQALQELLDELEASTASRRRAWEKDPAKLVSYGISR